MATDVKNTWGELSPGDIIIAHDDFALVLVVHDNWPEEWIWLGSATRATAVSLSQHYIQYLFEGRAILRPDGQVVLCQSDRSSSGWNDQALEWFRAVETSV